MLEKEPGWEVTCVENGREAWEKLGGGNVFDVWIFDIMMPEMDGLQLAARMRADPRFEEQAVIFCTALNDRATVKRAAELWANHYITKPYTGDAVIRQGRRAASNRPSSVRIGRVEACPARLAR